MTDEVDLQYLPVDDLAKRCAQETELFFQHRVQDSKYCFELFRRAVRDTNQFAWDMIYAQYKSLVTGWVKNSPAFEASGEQMEAGLPGMRFNLWRQRASQLRILRRGEGMRLGARIGGGG